MDFGYEFSVKCDGGGFGNFIVDVEVVVVYYIFGC